MTTTPLRTEAQVDRNWISLNSDTVVLFAGTDHEVHLPKDTTFEASLNYIPDFPKDWESALKVSGRQGVYMTDLKVAQCKENALDVNWSKDVCLHGEWGFAGFEGEQTITIKGGSSHIKVSGIVHSHGTRADFILGLWSDQSFDPTEKIDLSELRSSSSRNVIGLERLTVILCRVHQPWKAWLLGSAPNDIQLPPGSKVLRLKSLGAQCHWFLKRAAVKIGLIKGRSA